MSRLLSTGKVRSVYDIGYGILQMVASDRCSAFDRYICDIPGKGACLNEQSAWWFNKTRQIVPNHFLGIVGNSMFVKKCVPFKIEVVVRGYITGSTRTSLWTRYAAGEREYCGQTFPDGLVKNQKLSQNVVTPTTKGSTEDVPISEMEIVETGLATAEEWDYIKSKALELFEYGQYIADKLGLILVDTKYEFGKDSSKRILLIDELYTCDSSRYWIKESYSLDREPEKLDKDAIRDYIIGTGCDPYHDQIPAIPEEYIRRVASVYFEMCQKLTGHRPEILPELPDVERENYFASRQSNIAVIIAESIHDAWFVIDKLKAALRNEGVFSILHYASAYKEPEQVLEHLQRYNRAEQIVYITCSGSLSGLVAANTHHPVIACPVYKDQLDMLVNMQTTLQMPNRVPSMVVFSPWNAALAAARILNVK